MPACLPACPPAWVDAQVLTCLPGAGPAPQTELLLVAMELMQRGSLAAALRCTEAREELRWRARWVLLAACTSRWAGSLHE